MWTYWEQGGAGLGSPGALTCMLGPRRLLCCWCCRWVNASLGLFTPAILAWCLRSWMSSRVSSSGCSQARISEEWENILENHLGSYINWESQMAERPVYFRKILINEKKTKKNLAVWKQQLHFKYWEDNLLCYQELLWWWSELESLIN